MSGCISRYTLSSGFTDSGNRDSQGGFGCDSVYFKTDRWHLKLFMYRSLSPLDLRQCMRSMHGSEVAVRPYKPGQPVAALTGYYVQYPHKPELYSISLRSASSLKQTVG